MPDMKLDCPHCNQSLEVPDEMLGEAFDCPECGQSIQLPDPDPDEEQNELASPPDAEPTAGGKQVRVPRSVLISRPGIPVHEVPASDKAPHTISGLFDFGFKHFVTPGLIRALYVFCFLVVTLAAVGGMVASGFSLATRRDDALPMVSLVLAPVAWLIFLICVRVTLEFIMVVFSIEKNTKTLADNADEHQKKGGVS